jgi:cobaltochelatase CobS
MTMQPFVVRDTFGVEVPAEITVAGFAERSPFVPDVDPEYLFRRELLSDVLAWWTLGRQDGLYLTGPTGAGKSSLVLQVAARLNIAVQRVTAHGRLELPELIGHHTVLGGDLLYVDGPLTTALRLGHLLLLDELDVLDPATAAGLNGIVEGAPLTIAENGGELVSRHPQFRFVATGNTAGSGDATGLYQGTLRQNLAFLDRFWLVAVDYPSPSEERQILARAAPQLPELVRDKLVEVAGEVRRLFLGQADAGAGIEVTLSTRTLVRWAQLTWFFAGLATQGISPLHHALDRALGFRAEPETRTALHGLVQRVFGEEATPA